MALSIFVSLGLEVCMFRVVMVVLMCRAVHSNIHVINTNGACQAVHSNIYAVKILNTTSGTIVA